MARGLGEGVVSLPSSCLNKCCRIWNEKLRWITAVETFPTGTVYNNRQVRRKGLPEFVNTFIKLRVVFLEIMWITRKVWTVNVRTGNDGGPELVRALLEIQINLICLSPASGIGRVANVRAPDLPRLRPLAFLSCGGNRHFANFAPPPPSHQGSHGRRPYVIRIVDCSLNMMRTLAVITITYWRF